MERTSLRLRRYRRHQRRDGFFRGDVADKHTPDDVTYLTILNLAMKTNTLEEYGRKILENIAASENNKSKQLFKTIKEVEEKLGVKHDAISFLKGKDVYAWNVAISMRSKISVLETMNIFEEMKKCGVKPNNITYVSLISMCTNTRSIELGKKIHSEILELTVPLMNALVNMYGQFEGVQSALKILQDARECGIECDNGTWSTLFTLCGKERNLGLGMSLIHQLIAAVNKPSPSNYVTLLGLSASEKSLADGQIIFDHLKNDPKNFQHPALISSLIRLYGNCKGLKAAKKLLFELKN